jgi:hypothetical protein
MKINGAHLEIGKHGGFLCFSARKNKYTHAHNMHDEGSMLRWSVEKKRSASSAGAVQERYLGDVRACVRHKAPLRAGKSLLSYAYRRCAGNLENILRWVTCPCASQMNFHFSCVACEMTRVAIYTGPIDRLSLSLSPRARSAAALI